MQSVAIPFNQTLPIPFPRSLFNLKSLTPQGVFKMIRENEILQPYEEKKPCFLESIPSMSIFHLTKQTHAEYKTTYDNLQKHKSSIFSWLQAHSILGRL